MGFLRDLKNLLKTGSRHPGREVVSDQREVDNLDAGAAATTATHLKGAPGMTAGPSYPPGYVKEYDEGRPRK
jgi:hypothetical protein